MASRGTGGGNGTKHSSTSSAVAAKLKLSQKVSAASGSSTSGGAVAATTAAWAASTNRGTTTDSGKIKNKGVKGVKGATGAGKKGIALNSSGRVQTDASMYAESLAFLSSPPEQALKGVGPKRGEQLARLGTVGGDAGRRCCSFFFDVLQLVCPVASAVHPTIVTLLLLNITCQPSFCRHFTRHAHITCDQGIHSVANLLWHLPTGVIDRRQVSRVQGLVEGEIATVLLKVCGVGATLCRLKPVE